MDSVDCSTLNVRRVQVTWDTDWHRKLISKPNLLGDIEDFRAGYEHERRIESLYGKLASNVFGFGGQIRVSVWVASGDKEIALRGEGDTENSK